MDPLILVLIGLAALGAGVLAAFAAAVAYVILFAMLFVFVIVVMIAGTIGDHFHNKKVLRGEAPYRLPWYYRWKGWQVGGSSDIWKTGLFYDRRVNRIVCIARHDLGQRD